MVKYALLAALISIMAGVGFAIGKYIFPAANTSEIIASTKDTLYKLPLGRFTIQVVKPNRFLNIRFNMDIFIVGAANFDSMNDGLSRNQMREDVIRYLSDLVETTLWVKETSQEDIDQVGLARIIIQKLKRDYPMVRRAEMSNFATSRTER